MIYNSTRMSREESNKAKATDDRGRTIWLRVPRIPSMSPKSSPPPSSSELDLVDNEKDKVVKDAPAMSLTASDTTEVTEAVANLVPVQAKAPITEKLNEDSITIEEKCSSTLIQLCCTICCQMFPERPAVPEVPVIEGLSEEDAKAQILKVLCSQLNVPQFYDAVVQQNALKVTLEAFLLCPECTAYGVKLFEMSESLTKLLRDYNSLGISFQDIIVNSESQEVIPEVNAADGRLNMLSFRALVKAEAQVVDPGGVVETVEVEGNNDEAELSNESSEWAYSATMASVLQTNQHAVFVMDHEEVFPVDDFQDRVSPSPPYSPISNCDDSFNILDLVNSDNDKSQSQELLTQKTQSSKQVKTVDQSDRAVRKKYIDESESDSDGSSLFIPITPANQSPPPPPQIKPRGRPPSKKSPSSPSKEKLQRITVSKIKKAAARRRRPPKSTNKVNLKKKLATKFVDICHKMFDMTEEEKKIMIKLPPVDVEGYKKMLKLGIPFRRLTVKLSSVSHETIKKMIKPATIMDQGDAEMHKVGEADKTTTFTKKADKMIGNPAKIVEDEMVSESCLLITEEEYAEIQTENCVTPPKNTTVLAGTAPIANGIPPSQLKIEAQTHQSPLVIRNAALGKREIKPTLKYVEWSNKRNSLSGSDSQNRIVVRVKCKRRKAQLKKTLVEDAVDADPKSTQEELSCTTCGKSFTSQSVLEDHKQSHSSTLVKQKKFKSEDDSSLVDTSSTQPLQPQILKSKSNENTRQISTESEPPHLCRMDSEPSEENALLCGVDENQNRPPPRLHPFGCVIE